MRRVALLLALASLVVSGALGLKVGQQPHLGDRDSIPTAFHRHLAAKASFATLGSAGVAARKVAEEDASLHLHNSHTQHTDDALDFETAVQSDRYTSAKDARVDFDEEFVTDEENGEQNFSTEAPEDKPSSWPKFGIVGERQAAIYYSSFLVFSVFFYRSSLGALGAPKSQKEGL